MRRSDLSSLLVLASLSGFSPAGCSSSIEPTGRASEALGGESIAPVTSCTLPAKTTWGDAHATTGTSSASQFVEIITPPSGITVSPVGILFVHGGSYTTGSWTAGSGSPAGFGIPTDARGVALPYASVGYVTFVVSYRLAPAYRDPAQISDVRCAARWVAAHASSYGVDASRLVAIGGSVGGQLALGAALGIGSDDGTCLDGATGMPAVKAMVGWSAVEDLTDTGGQVPTAAANLLGASPTHAAEVADSPLDAVSAAAPPLLLLHWTGDPVVPVTEARSMHTASQGAGALATLIETAGAYHEPAILSLAWPTPGCTLTAFLAEQ